MSRSFIVDFDNYENITFRDIIEKLYELRDFDKLVDMKQASISKRVNDVSTAITEDLLDTSINEGYFSFLIDEGPILLHSAREIPILIPIILTNIIITLKAAI